MRNAAFFLVLAISAFLLWQVVRGSSTGPRTPEISYSAFLSQIEAGNVVQVTLSKNQVNGKYKDNSSFRVIVPSSQEGLLASLYQKKVEIVVKDEVTGSAWMNFVPILLLAALWLVMIRQMNAKRRTTSTS